MEFRSLKEEERNSLIGALQMASRVANKNGPLDVDGVQNLYNSFLTESIEVPEAVVALGLAFGQLFVTNYDYEWVRISDEYGEETVVSPKGWMTMCAPISMIQKRLEQKISVDIRMLMDDTTEVINDQIKTGIQSR